MRDVKEIAAEMRVASSVNQDPFMATYLRVWADELEKLANAEQKPTSVSREALRKALRDNHSPDVTPEDVVEMALRALGIEVTP